MSNLLQGVKVLVQSGRLGDIVKVDAPGILEHPLIPVPSVSIDRVEYCFDQWDRLTDVIYRLVEGRCDWRFVEIGFSTINPGVIVEARIMRKVDDASTLAENDEVAVVDYAGDEYYPYAEGVSDVLLLTSENGLRRDIQMRWEVFRPEPTSPYQKQLVYAWWEGGSGIYWGYVIPPESVSIYMKVPEATESLAN